jgi:hypothetical protein
MKRKSLAPDPGTGYRLIDKSVDTPHEGDEVWDYSEESWCERPEWARNSPWSIVDFYRRRITPEPVCKREAFSGGGSPSPRECDVCGEGPCTKESPDDCVTQEIHLGDDVVVTACTNDQVSWVGCRRTVQAKVKNGYVIGKLGEPISRIYLASQLRVIPKSDGE